LLVASLPFASMASAARFASTSDSAIFTGEGIGGNWNFNTGLGSSECRASSSATLSEASNTLTINRIHLDRCTSKGRFGPKPITMKMEGCYTLVQIEDRTGTTYTGESNLICPGGTSILGYDDERFCAIRIPPQAGKVSLKYTDGSASGYELQVSTSSVTYDVVYDAPFCPLERGRYRTGSQGRGVDR
jgi:hypothetical protein